MGACAVCSSPIRPFVSYGRQPIANGFLGASQVEGEYFFSLDVGFCPTCTMVQLMEQPEREKMFNENYAFFSGTSRYMSVHFAEFADGIASKYFESKDPFVVEIGSNDGIMLKNFASRGVRHLGIEPSAERSRGGPGERRRTLCRFFDAETARLVVAENGQAGAFHRRERDVSYPVSALGHRRHPRSAQANGASPRSKILTWATSSKRRLTTRSTTSTCSCSPCRRLNTSSGQHGLELIDVAAARPRTAVRCATCWRGRSPPGFRSES